MTLATSKYEYMVKTWGKDWADRVRCESEHGQPPEPLNERGCPLCAGFGAPGWVVFERNWKKCECYSREDELDE